MTLQEFYARVGGDYNATLSRLPSEALVKKFILKYPGDPSFAQLKDALAAQDWELAFRASHTLKGVAQNLGMDRLYKAAAALCDAVRGPKPLEDESLWAARPCCPRGSAGGNPRTVKPPLQVGPAEYYVRRLCRCTGNRSAPAMYNKKENLPTLRRTVCCLLLTSMLLAAMTRPGAPCV